VKHFINRKIFIFVIEFLEIIKEVVMQWFISFMVDDEFQHSIVRKIKKR